MTIELGFFTRPWSRQPAEAVIAGIAATGARLVGYIHHSGLPAVHRDAPPDEIAAWNALLARHDLQMCVHVPRVRMELSDDEYLAAYERELDVATQIGAPYLITGGTQDAALYERYFALMHSVAEAVQRRGKLMLIKPHGGLTNTAHDCLNLVRRIDHPALRISYDPGNVCYYTGADPLDGLAALVPYIAGLCIKDCVHGGTAQRSVNVQPGHGDVDFPRFFAILNDGGFQGHGLVETLGSGPLEEVNRQARETVAFVRELTM